MLNPIFSTSLFVKGFARSPAPILQSIVNKNTAAVFHTTAAERLLIGTSNPIVHEKNTRISHCRILLTWPSEALTFLENKIKLVVEIG